LIVCFGLVVAIFMVACGGDEKAAPTAVPESTMAPPVATLTDVPAPEVAAPPAVIGAASVEPPTEPPAPLGPIDVPTIRSFKVGSGPISLLYHDGAMMVVNQDDDSLTRLALDGSEIWTRPLHTYPRTLISDGESLWAGTYFAIRKMTAEAEVQGVWAAGRHPVAMASGAGYVWVANDQDNTVSRFAPDGTLESFAIGRQPAALVFDGSSIWVANQGDNTLSKLSSTGELLGTYPTENGPNPYFPDTVDLRLAFP
jgi:serine/threonine-protein kinase